MQIGSPEDAKSVVRRYITGTRSRHGKITSVVIDDEVKRPNQEGMWAMKGIYTTEEGGKQHFSASVTSKGEVRLTVAEPDAAPAKRPTAPRRR